MQVLDPGISELITSLNEKDIKVANIRSDLPNPEILINKKDLVKIAMLINRWEATLCDRYEFPARILLSSRGNHIAIYCGGQADGKWKKYFVNFGRFLASS